MKINFDIRPISSHLAEPLQQKLDSGAKIVGSLGVLEELALKIGCIQNSLNPSLNKPTMLLFAGDHGIVEEGVSPSPQEVTYQMVMNFLQGGAAINVLTNQHNIDLKIIDAGVIHDFKSYPNLIKAKIAKGTKSFIHGPAMTKEQCTHAIAIAADIIENIHKKGCNIVGFGEMGIGNTSASSVLMNIISGIPLEKCVGKGGGLNESGVERKIEILTQAIANNPIDKDDPLDILSTFSGFEHAMIVGSMLKAAELGMILLIDGFIAGSALMVAHKFNKNILDYCIFAHQSSEKGHDLMLKYFDAKPLLDLRMHLGEGTGAAVAYPLLESAVNLLNEMATFEQAKVIRVG